MALENFLPSPGEKILHLPVHAGFYEEEPYLMMDKNQERCLKCAYCELEDFFWDGKRLCLLYRCRIYRDTIQKAAAKCPYHLKTNKPTGDMIRHPDHYTFRGREAIEAVRIMTGKSEGQAAYLEGCAVKYLYRYPRKNGKQDLDKAIECLAMLRKIEASSQK
jgi:hypothetical protein|nr:MAG TPA_asm: nucelotide kinase [Bacteriophage sp.]